MKRLIGRVSSRAIKKSLAILEASGSQWVKSSTMISSRQQNCQASISWFELGWTPRPPVGYRGHCGHPRASQRWVGRVPSKASSARNATSWCSGEAGCLPGGHLMAVLERVPHGFMMTLTPCYPSAGKIRVPGSPLAIISPYSETYPEKYPTNLALGKNDSWLLSELLPMTCAGNIRIPLDTRPSLPQQQSTWQKHYFRAMKNTPLSHPTS